MVWRRRLSIAAPYSWYLRGERRFCLVALSHPPGLLLPPISRSNQEKKRRDEEDVRALAAALVYRLPAAWRGPKLPWKVLHGALALTAFGLTVVGLVAVFGFHNASKTPNMYSLHSWLGLATVLLFSCQWLAGFSAFLLPYSPPWLRALYKPVHVFFGSTILMLSVASCVSGINEKLFFSLKNGTATTPYNRLPPEAVFANVLGLLIVLFGVLVLCALAKPDWKRPEDDSTDTRQPLLGTER
nr:lysosomal membrane ascorbate-dependent ferrireductase CYB561A3 [Anser cygnoides]